jgi:YfiH family protein
MKSKIQHPQFSFENIEHAFLTSNIEGSTNRYLANMHGMLDNEAESIHNRELAAQCFIGENMPINLVRQIHGTNVVTLTDNIAIGKEAKADAMVTNKKGLICAIYTADCVPILFADPKNKVIGAAHAGWKGAKNGIIEATIAKMKDLGAKEIYAVIGACIHQQSYEIAQEFYDEFLNKDANNKRFFKTTQKQNHYLFDLPGYVTAKLHEAHVKEVFNINQDTLSNPDKFFSYRRNTLNSVNNKQFLISLIQIKS